MIQILGPADNDLPVIAIDDEVIKVHHIDEQGVWMQHRTGPGEYSEPQLPTVEAEEQLLDGPLLQRLRLNKT